MPTATVVQLKAKGRRVPTTQNGKVNPPQRVPNKDRRSREYLTPSEVDRLIDAAGKGSRYPQRDRALLLLAYRHALRVGELVVLRWDQVDLRHGLLHVARLKNGTPSTHPLRGPELRALRQLKRDGDSTAYVFSSERGGPMTTSNVRKMVARAGELAKLGFPVHPHMLRHAAGFKLANDGHDTRALQHYMGHKSIQHTVRYTELRPDRFRDFWHD